MRRVVAAVLAACALAGPAAAATGTLTIASPVAGATVRAPFAVRYAVTDVRVAPSAPAVLQVYTGAARASFHVDVLVTRATGAAIVPNDPRLSGRRTLTFVLARRSGRILAAAVVVRNVVVEGARRR